MKKVLVTGATGFIGRHIIRDLLKQGYKIRILSRNLKSFNDNIKVIKGDITNANSLKKACSDVDYVLHLAALTNVDKFTPNQHALFKKINVNGTINLLNACDDVERFIHFSSIDALGIIEDKVLNENSEANPSRPYEISKYESELKVKKYEKENGIPTTILRPALVYGEGEIIDLMKINVVVLQMCKMIKKHIFPIIGSGKNHLPFTHVKNIVDGTLLALNSKKAIGQTYFLGDERSYSLNETVKIISDIQGVKFPGFHIPKPIAYTAAFFFETIGNLLKVNPPLSKSGIEYITANRLFSIKKAKIDFNYNPINLKEGLKRTIEWYNLKGYL